MVADIGAAGFGLVIGWVTYRTLRRREGAAALSDIATVIAAVGGTAVVSLFDNQNLFGWYAIGLTVGFFAYFVIGMLAQGKGEQTWTQWMGD
jgi:hypothetical protein